MAEFKAKIKKKPIADINVVPYIDVMLVLLIVFMVAAHMMSQGVKVDLPKASAEPIDTKDQEPINVSVKKDGSYYIDLGGDPEKPRNIAEIKSIVSKVLSQKPNTLVFVQGDRSVQYGVIVTLMSELKSAGAASVGLITDPPAK